jgi:hypothetical protein
VTVEDLKKRYPFLLPVFADGSWAELAAKSESEFPQFPHLDGYVLFIAAWTTARALADGLKRGEIGEECLCDACRSRLDTSVERTLVLLHAIAKAFQAPRGGGPPRDTRLTP